MRAHARLPMHLVLRAAARGGRRAGIGSPFQMFFSLIHDPKVDLTIDGKPLLPWNSEPTVCQVFNSFLLVEERAESTSLKLEFQRGVLDPEMGERLLAQLEWLLRSAVAQVDMPLSKLLSSRLESWSDCER